MAISVISSIDLDMARPTGSIVHAKQFDSIRTIRARLYNEGILWSVPTNVHPVITYMKSDRIGGYYDVDETGTYCIGYVDGTNRTQIDIILAFQVLTTAGNVTMDITFYTDQGTRVSTFSWTVVVEPSALPDGKVVSSEYYNILSQQIARVLEASDSLTGMTASAKSLPVGSNPTAEVTGGSDGVPYNVELGIPQAPPATPQIQVDYQGSTSGSTPPTGTWQSTPPSIAAGQYLWTRNRMTFGSGTNTFYCVARQGNDGAGAPGTQTPKPVAKTAAIGSSASFAREDHIHALPVDLIYPVGAIYLSVNSTNPGTLFGGTWTQIKDRFLLTCGDNYEAGTTGGEATHTLTVAEMPSHDHTGIYWDNAMRQDQPWGINNDGIGNGFSSDYRTERGGPNADHELYTGYTGGGQAHNNMPPYIAVYAWRRDA